MSGSLLAKFLFPSCAGMSNAGTAVSALLPLRCHAPFLYLKMLTTAVQELLSDSITKASHYFPVYQFKEKEK